MYSAGVQQDSTPPVLAAARGTTAEGSQLCFIVVCGSERLEQRACLLSSCMCLGLHAC